MTNKSIPSLTAATTPLAGTETLPVFQGSTTVKATVADILTPASGNGLNFGAVTPAAGMTSKVLTNYEEGTWTPVRGAGITLVGTFSASGTYTRVGRQVTCTALLNGSTSVATVAGQILCTGLPFTPVSPGGGIIINAAVNASGAIWAITGGSVYVTVTIAATTQLGITFTYFV